MQTPRGPIEQLRIDLHARILRVIQPSADAKAMHWTEFQRRARRDRWDRHLQWKLVEGELKWGPDTYIEVARNLGIPVVIAVGEPGESSASGVAGAA